MFWLWKVCKYYTDISAYEYDDCCDWIRFAWVETNADWRWYFRIYGNCCVDRYVWVVFMMKSLMWDKWYADIPLLTIDTTIYSTSEEDNTKRSFHYTYELFAKSMSISLFKLIVMNRCSCIRTLSLFLFFCKAYTQRSLHVHSKKTNRSGRKVIWEKTTGFPSIWMSLRSLRSWRRRRGGGGGRGGKCWWRRNRSCPFILDTTMGNA